MKQVRFNGEAGKPGRPMVRTYLRDGDQLPGDEPPLLPDAAVTEEPEKEEEQEAAEEEEAVEQADEEDEVPLMPQLSVAPPAAALLAAGGDKRAQLALLYDREWTYHCLGVGMAKTREAPTVALV